jgi:hypothetical protein
MLLALALLAGQGVAVAAEPLHPTETCGDATNPTKSVSLLPQGLLTPVGPDSQPDLKVVGLCVVSNNLQNRQYLYRNVNIVAGGELRFVEQADTTIDVWFKSVIIENGGKLTAGAWGQPFGRLGQHKAILTIHLYGQEQSKYTRKLNLADPDPNKRDGWTITQGQGAICKSPLNGVAPCDIPEDTWLRGAQAPKPLPTDQQGVTYSDYFYAYDPLYTDGGASEGAVGYFGYKVLGVSYGGSLNLFGYKGATYDQSVDLDPSDPGISWIRLANGNNLAAKAKGLALDPLAPVLGNWQAGDQIVVTTTDYLPSHSEQLTITGVPSSNTIGFSRTYQDKGDFHLKPCTATADDPCGVQFAHNGTRYPLANRITQARMKANLDPALLADGVETRAAVALLSRSIRIVSEGDLPNQTWDAATAKNPSYAFGAHTVARQGFAAFHVQGVEFYHMGVGGKLGHYPVHFHMARHTPPGTYLRDSSIHDSMTRWVVLHSTQNVTLQRNVGYLSIGHGYYLEDGTETDNKLYANAGILARAAIENVLNPRKVKGILADNTVGTTPQSTGYTWDQGADDFPYASDWNHPTVFWITNGWNEFVGNMAAGAGTCGACYWFVPGWNSGITDDANSMTKTPMAMAWSGYSFLQRHSGFEGTTPLKSFYGNSCAAAMNSFQTVGNTAICRGFIQADYAGGPTNPADVKAVTSIAPVRLQTQDPNSKLWSPAPDGETYYPRVHAGAGRKATRCPAVMDGGKPKLDQWGEVIYDCSATKVSTCSSADPKLNPDPGAGCMVTVLDHFTTAFNWAETNLAAVWMRPYWALLDNSVISDVQNGGLTIVTGGDYTRSSVIQGYWGLSANSIFIGETQPGTALGPFSDKVPNDTGRPACTHVEGNWCLNAGESVSLPMNNHQVNQRLVSIYDGPSYEDSNAFVNIPTTKCTDANGCIYMKAQGVRKNPNITGDPQAGCYLPNAAVAWKQPNGFYYPPAFDSANLLFDGTVAIRHYVVEPFFDPGTYLSKLPATQAMIRSNYCSAVPDNPAGYFTGFTDVDRQTVLLDDDGTLTGLTNNMLIKPKMGTTPAVYGATVSVNEDPFFQTPLATAECLSNVGVTAAKACPATPPPTLIPPATADTSPYDYVTTVVLPGCTQSGSGPCLEVANKDSTIVWSSPCSNENCYGVPIFRQLLTKAEMNRWTAGKCDGYSGKTSALPANCRFPFIRMAGENISQRSTLTVNHGNYYIDTTVSYEQQRTENFNNAPCTTAPDCPGRQFNVFAEGQTYYVFFIFAKPSIRQTYRMFVGTGLTGFENDTNNLYTVHGSLFTKPTQFTPKQADSHSWEWAGWKKSYDAKTGVLTVTVDFADPQIASQQLLSHTTDANGLCAPARFCAWTGQSGAADRTCGCALGDDDPLVKASVLIGGKSKLKQDCQNACATWAVKDLDCPRSGCLGFAVKLGSSFAADQYARPKPVLFTDTSVPATDWATQFLKTALPPDSAAGQCFYSKVPGDKTTCPANN